MDFKESLLELASRIVKVKSRVQTEEATKTAFIMPFIKLLGYDYTNPLEVVPEYISDIGTKKGEKIDYAIFKDDNPVILIECKHWNQDLDLHDGQLLRYFHVSKAKFGVLTNGITYRFYTDLIQPNKMDEKPFFEFDITEIKDNQIEELKKFHKTNFDIETIVSTASDLKYTNDLRNILRKEFSEPSTDFIKHFARQVYPGHLREKQIEQFGNLIKTSIKLHISDIITDRLKTALDKEDKVTKENEAAQAAALKEPPKIITTEEELEGYLIIKAILREKIDVNRITYRDAQSYFSVLLDDNNRKPLCRLYLDGTKKYFVHFDNDKKEIKEEISSVDEIFRHADKLHAMLSRYI